MLGPEIIVRSLSVPAVDDKHGNIWQYHSRSDRHSKVACWAILFDLLRTSALLRAHVEQKKVCFGINHQMTDFASGRHKNLDLVICVPHSSSVTTLTFASLVPTYGIELTTAEAETLSTLPSLESRSVADVLVAMEAKAAMTKHSSAGPRFNDELTSAYQCINGSAQNAIAVGFAMVNSSTEFVSPDGNRRKNAIATASVNRQPQPRAAEHIVGRMRKLAVRAFPTEQGFDALGLLTVMMRNDGSPVQLVTVPPAVSANDPLNYEMMVRRIASAYEIRFATR